MVNSAGLYEHPGPVQAKRYGNGNNIGPGAIRDFFGSLDRHKAAKGLFVTTSEFSPAARETAKLLSKRIVLIVIRARTSEGRARAVARGVKLGRKPKLTSHQIKEVLRRKENGEAVREIARIYNVHNSTISRLAG